ncbi:uncharacterized protein LOC128730981 [Anopheles nili]|uniref:uncharacterized protein LOC128730981 n=1 Tax=Anopheles nili TaxID=185578 RepID=UPI00237B0BEB|nr:uncharacterized protein LOC128730981 [Anopheles nili]
MKKLRLIAVGVGFVLLLKIALSASAPLDDAPLEKHNLEQMRTIVEGIIHSGVDISLDEHQIRFIKADPSTVREDVYIFSTDDATIITVTIEEVVDKNYVPKVVSFADIFVDNGQKLLLSMLGGGNIKTLTVSKDR